METNVKTFDCGVNKLRGRSRCISACRSGSGLVDEAIVGAVVAVVVVVVAVVGVDEDDGIVVVVVVSKGGGYRGVVLTTATNESGTSTGSSRCSELRSFSSIISMLSDVDAVGADTIPASVVSLSSPADADA